MAIKTISAQKGQNMLDITLQEFGTLENLFELLTLNNLNPNDILNSNQQLFIDNEGVGNETIKEFVFKTNVKFNNDGDISTVLPPLESGDFNNDFNNDFF